jgi:hypothetical protein
MQISRAHITFFIGTLLNVHSGISGCLK